MSEELNLIVPDELFKGRVEDKILERFNRYVSRILEMKGMLKNGFKTEQDFRNFYDLFNKIENEQDFLNVKADIDYYHSLRRLITYSYK